MALSRASLLFTVLLAVSLQGCRSLDAPVQVDADPPIQVLVLGTYHMGNPGQDVVNMEAEDVTSTRRQGELAQLAETLAAFEPTLIAVESATDAPGLVDRGFAAFDPAKDLATERDETVQIAYRLAALADVDRVVAIDVHEGEISFFPFEAVTAFAEKAGRSHEVDELVAYFGAKAAAFEEEQSGSTITELLLDQNDPETLEHDHRAFYYGMLSMGDESEQPGAALNYGWYARNALIFARLMAVAKPGDRIVVVYGAGHAYWLRHFVEESPGYELVELAEYAER